ncbi:hypothetical protein K474DRAFT_739255 [Panus rudis PR-1116 ss-1]|nr:hypothetical protein K474DRAFT_739255 [Panus rudis PR-1116 ss-1]
MRFSTVYVVAVASAAAPAVLAIPFHVPNLRREVSATYDAPFRGEVHAVAPRLFHDESGALDAAAVHSLLSRALYQNQKRGSNPSQAGGSSNSLLNRIGGVAPAGGQPAQGPSGQASAPAPPLPPNGQTLGAHTIGSKLGPNADGTHPVLVQFSGNTLAGQPARQEPTLNQVGDHIRTQANAANLRDAKTTDITIHQTDHTSGSEGGQPHASYNAYKDGELVRTGHVPGSMYLPNQNAQEKWGTMKPATAGQADKVVDIGPHNTLPDPPAH